MYTWIGIVTVFAAIAIIVGCVVIIPRRNVVSLLVFLVAILAIFGFWVKGHNYVFDSAVGNGYVVGTCDEVEVNQSIYYDSTEDAYFYLAVDDWNPDYYRVYLNKETTAEYIRLMNRLSELNLEALK